MTRAFILLLLLLPVAVVAADDGVADRTILSLGSDLVVRLAPSGELSVAWIDAGDTTTALRITGAEDLNPRTRTTSREIEEIDSVFLAIAEEGDPRGRRGFAADRDDDQDGREDEDRLDGVDNDGDGEIDEDYAAIGHEMIAWNRTDGQRTRHLELYHWTYATLSSLVAADLTQEGTGREEPLRLALPAGAAWQPVGSLCPDLAADLAGPAFLAAVDRPAPQPPVWLGVVLLDRQIRSRSAERVHAAGTELSVPVLEGRQTLVLAAAASRLPVLDDLTAATALHDGMADPVSGQRVPWLPRPVAPREQEPVPVPLIPVTPGRYELHLAVDGPEDAALDPDRVHIEDRSPVSVQRLVWRPRGGDETHLDWRSTHLGTAACQPHQALDIVGPGTLVFEIDGLLPADGEMLRIGRLDGREDLFRLAIESQLAGSDETAGTIDDDPAEPLRLSPRLLSNYPNPFRDHTRISYTVPATVGEAFDLDGPDAPALDPARAMPYVADPPRVAVLIFSLEGRVVAELQAGPQGVGVYEVGWDGRDPSGRTLPSGAYFCKLQIEKWDVTKRLIFVR
jgi:hypothetical protein